MVLLVSASAILMGPAGGLKMKVVPIDVNPLTPGSLVIMFDNVITALSVGLFKSISVTRPSQIVTALLVTVHVGIGFTSTKALWEVTLVQPAADISNTYSIVSIEIVLFKRGSDTTLPSRKVVPIGEYPVMKPGITLISVITAPAVGEDKRIDVRSPEQILGSVLVMENIGPGFTIIVTCLLMGSVHPFAAISNV